MKNTNSSNPSSSLGSRALAKRMDAMLTALPAALKGEIATLMIGLALVASPGPDACVGCAGIALTMDLEGAQWVCSNCNLEFGILYAAGKRRTRGSARPTIHKNGQVAMPTGFPQHHPTPRSSNGAENS